MFAYPFYQIALMAKSPILGKAKTRLQPRYSECFSLRLHSQLLDFILQQLTDGKVCPFQLWLAGSDENFYKQLPQWQSLQLKSQQGHDLGERMANAVKETCRDHYRGVILLGSDCPFIDSSYLHTACEMLQAYDVVIGPATDGGYVLLGMNAEHPELFSDVEWGGDSVYAETLKRIRALGLSVAILPTLSDIDHPEDLQSLSVIPFFRHTLNAVGII